MCHHHPDQDLEHSIITPESSPVPCPMNLTSLSPRQPLIFFPALEEGCALSNTDFCDGHGFFLFVQSVVPGPSSVWPCGPQEALTMVG